jgi:excisionase family DNA binding protein
VIRYAVSGLRELFFSLKNGSISEYKFQGGRAVERETLTIMKACEVVGVSRRTIYNWISRGKVEYVRTAGGSIRIFADTLWRSSGHETPQQTVEQAPDTTTATIPS